MIKIKKIVPIIFGILFFAGFGGGAYYFVTHPPENDSPAHVAILLDGSDSMNPDPECASLSALIHRSFKLSGIRRNSKIFIFRTGAPETLYEPTQLSVLEVPSLVRIMEGREALKRKRESTTLEALNKCKSVNSLTKTSPIFLAIKRAVVQLRSNGCNGKTLCYLFIRTDGEETEEEWLYNSMKKGKPLKKGMPQPIDNTGISIHFCGLSEKVMVNKSTTRKQRNERKQVINADLIISLWKQVFTKSEGIVFEPVCPKGEVN